MDVYFSLGQAILTGLVRLGLFAAVLIAISHWMVFQKAGKPGWAAIVPIYNGVVLMRVAGKPGWWLALYLIPIVDIVVAYQVNVALARNFGKSKGFGVGLLLLPFVFFPILADGDGKYLEAPAVQTTGGRAGALWAACLIFLLLQSAVGVVESLLAQDPPAEGRLLAVCANAACLVGLVGIWRLQKWGAYLYFPAALMIVGMGLRVPDARLIQSGPATITFRVGFAALAAQAIFHAILLVLLAWAVKRRWLHLR